MRKFLLCLSVLIFMVQAPSYAQSPTDTVDAFTTEEFVLNDRHFSVNVDRFNTCLLVMLSYYYPEQFSLTDTEVKDLIDGYVKGENAGHRFVFNADQKAAISKMLKLDLLESTTASRVLKFFISKSNIAPGFNIVLYQEGFEIPPEVSDSINLFYSENIDSMHYFERDVISIVKRRISPMVEFLGKEKQYDFLPHKPLSMYITFANDIQYLQGMACDYAQNSVMLYGLASEKDDAVLFFHELAHLWASANEVKVNIISKIEKSEKKSEYIEILQNCKKKILQKEATQSESIVDIVDPIYETSFLGFEEFWAISFSKYLVSRYMAGSPEENYQFPFIASMNSTTWGHAKDLFDWITKTGYFNDAGLASDLRDMIYKKFVLFILCMDHGLDYALEKSGEFVQ